MFAQYTGALLLTGALVAIGLWASSLTRNQITAFIVALTVIFVLMAVTMSVVLIGLPPVLAAAATRLGLLTHFSAITRGVLDLRDLVYFVSITVAFLGLAYLMIERGRLNLKGSSWRSLRIGILGILLICVVVNLLGRHIRGRLDLTPGRTYTLSSTTRSVLGSLEDVVTIKFFASRELPPQVDLVKRDVEDLLADYAAAAGDNMQLLRFSPSAGDPEAVAEAEQMGIPAIQFNVLGQDEFQVRQAYLGISIQYADQTANVPFVRQTDDLEYRLTSAVLALTDPTRSTIGFLTGHGEADISGEASGLAETLGQNYQVAPVDITGGGIPDSVRVLIIQGPETPLSELEGTELRAFLAGGGNMLLMVQPLTIDETQAFPNPQPHPVLDGLLAEYGVAVPGGMVIDHRSSGRVTLSSGSGGGYVVPYPLWPIVVPASTHTMVEGLSGVLLPWASPLDLSGADTSTVTPLLATTEFGQHLTGSHPLNPRFDWNSIAADLRPQPMAAAILPRHSGTAAGASEAPGGGRLVLVGDADFASNRFLGGESGNIVFLTNAVDWLAQDESLIQIRSKLRSAPPLLYSSELMRDVAKYGNLIGVPLLFVLIGAWRLARRRRLQATRYGSTRGSGQPKTKATA
jgi:ABC-2 type transport system permease protein